MDTGYIILAGGKSTRLGRDKISETLGGRTLLQRVVSILASFKGEIIIVISNHSTYHSDFDCPNLTIIRDISPNQGSAGGIYTGLVKSRKFYNLVVAGDMPFLNFPLLQYMTDIAEGFDLVAYRKKDRFEPLHAIYSKNCLAPLKRIIKSNSRILELSRYVKVRYLTEEEIDTFDPRHLSFFNINTEADLKAARDLIRRE